MVRYSPIESNLPSEYNEDIEPTYINGPSKDDSYLASGYKLSPWRSLFFHVGGIFTFGFIYLLSYWRPDWAIYWKRRKASLHQADTLILKDIDGAIHVVDIKKELMQRKVFFEHTPNTNDSDQSYDSPQFHSASDGLREIRYFIFQYTKYIWNDNDETFHCVIGIKQDASIGFLLRNYHGYSHEEKISRLKLYGKNEIKIEAKPICQLLITEVLNPFYMFQVASIILWSMDDYVLYATCIFLISCLSIGASLHETRRQSKSLQHLIESSTPKSVKVSRLDELGTKIEVDSNSSDVVPGDIIVIPPTGCVMACDAVLLSGTAIVNESMLTGESVPVTKLSFASYEEPEIYSPEGHKRHTLFCGTTVIQTRYYGKDQVLALVTRTGFNTAKGELVRSILYPRPIDFKFYRDSLHFIAVLFCIALIGMSYSIYLYITYSKPVVQTIVRALDIITIVVPPALPAAMTVGTYYAQNRLKKLGIFCIAPARINVCGKVKLVCFDKTGTLTEDSLEVWGVIGSEECKNCKPQFSQPCFELSKLPCKSSLAAALATCHSLTHVNGELTGDPLDLKMFEATKWNLEEPGESGTTYDSLIPPVVRPPPDVFHIDEPNFCFYRSSIISPAFSNNISRSKINSFDQSYNDADNSDGTTRKTLSNSDFPPEVAASNLPPNVEDAPQSNQAKRAYEEIGKDGVLDQIPYEIGIVRQFPFSSSVQRMSVIVRVLGSAFMDVYTKGAPEVIQMLCLPHTVPENFNATLNHFAMQGFRVLAVAHKSLQSKKSWYSVQKMKRDQVECDLDFVGLIIFQNVLKRETTPVVHELKNANIRSVMVTGDNILTGICVARDCGMVEPDDQVLLAKVSEIDGERALSFELAHYRELNEECNDKTNQVEISFDSNYHLAVSGPVWRLIREHFPEYISLIVTQGTVFARMSPEQKVQLVEELQAVDYIVGMCGDGANDCGALKAAHIGVSLSEAEASVAAPFTSHTPNITCVPKIICEGRCALTTNFSVFKYMALYSIIQFVSVLILYKACSNLTDPQFLYIDLLIVTMVAIFMGHTKARHVLVAKRPLSSLIGPMNLFSVISQIILVIFVQILVYYYLLWQPWYFRDTDCKGENEFIVSSWETNVIFCVSSIQYISIAIIYSPGYPFRKSFYTNIWLLVTIVTLSCTSVWLLVYPYEWMNTLMGLKAFPGDPLLLFRATLLLIALFHFVLGWAMEYFISGSKLLKSFFQLIFCKSKPKNRFKRIKMAMMDDPTWPPVDSPIISSLVL